MDLCGMVAWEAVSFSSQEPSYEAASLNSASSARALKKLLTNSAAQAETSSIPGWRSEKFCEYPQELVFRVGPSDDFNAPPAIHSIVLVSDATLIPKRIEIFLSTTATKQWQKAKYHRLGYITMRSPQETQCAAQELKTVPIQQSAIAAERITFVRLLVHSCHVHKGNVFNQVGLGCLLARSEPLDTAQLYEEDIRSWSEAVSQKEHRQGPRSFADERVRGSDSSFPVGPWPTLKMGASASLPTLSSAGSTAIWDAEVGQYVTPTQILTRIQLARERHGVVMQSTLRTDDDLQRFQEEQRLWLLDELECKQLIDQLSGLQNAEVMARTVEERLVIRKKLDVALTSMARLATRVHLREGVMQRIVSQALILQLASSPVKTTKSLVRTSPTKPAFACPDWVKIEQWQSREEFVWRVVEAVKLWVEQDGTEASVRRSQGDESPSDPDVLNEALQIATAGLDDSHPQVFVAANALLQIVMTHHRRFHDGCAWKHDVVALIKQLSKRLDDLQPVVRNNAAFSIVKIAEKTRARGSFVLHHLLQFTEKQELQLTDQTLYGVVKVISALLQAFHCCATLDVSHKRVLKLLLTSDALIHENGHVRSAARELVVALHGEVGGEVIVEYFHKKKMPVEVVQSMEELFSVLLQKPSSGTQQTPKPDSLNGAATGTSVAL